MIFSFPKENYENYIYVITYSTGCLMQNITIERRLEGRFLINLFIKNTNNKIN